MAMRSVATWHIHLAGMAACAAVTAGLWSAAVQPQLNDRAHAADLRAELAARQQKAEDLTHGLSANRAQLAELQNELSNGRLRLEPVEGLNERIAAIDELATQNGLTFNERRPGSPADSPHYKSLPIHVTGRGTYPACTAFLHQLRTQFPDVGVATLQADTTNAGSQTSDVIFQFELIWYTRK